MGKKARLKLQKKLLRQEEKDHKNRRIISTATAITLIVVTSIILSMAFTLLQPGLPSGHDIAAHVVNLKLFQQALDQGQFPVRWSEGIHPGESLPLFNFYQIGFYYLASAIHIFIPALTGSIKATLLLSWWIGALFVFLWLRRFGNLPAALAAFVYTLTPYILLDIFVRAAYPEILAVSFSIGAFWALDRSLLSAKPIYGLPLSLLLAGLICSHLPTLVIITPVFLAYAVFLFLIGQARIKGLLVTGIGTILGLGLAAFYLVPALGELSLVKSQLLTSQYYDFHPHFVYPQQLFSTFWGYGISQAGPNDGMSFQFGLVQWIIIILSLSWIAFNKWQKKTSLLTPYLTFWLLAIVYATFFMHDISLSFWENIKPIGFIQYPWRYLMVVVISCAFLAGILISGLPKKWQQITAVFSTITLAFFLYHSYLAPAMLVPDSYFNIDSPNWRQSQGVERNGYLEEGYLPATVEQPLPQNIQRWNIIQNNKIDLRQTKVWEKLIHDQELVFTTQSPKPFGLQINSHYFPGWKAYIDNRETDIDHDNTFDVMDVSVPAGTHQVEVKFTNTLIRTLADTITIFSFVSLLSWQLFLLNPWKKLSKIIQRVDIF
ncbi:MAG: 6-pyruvoyl-tetrahydropterin synthase-related protein [Patescibacteria group bacterium]|nr:6-pyruvoyl-tetrahydropterin synthase-related protein [Patescibacteria group bacterium]